MEWKIIEPWEIDDKERIEMAKEFVDRYMKQRLTGLQEPAGVHSPWDGVGLATISEDQF